MGSIDLHVAQGPNHHADLEDGLYNIFSWVISHSQTVIAMGDLNLDRLKPDQKEGKLLKDMEDIFERKHIEMLQSQLLGRQFQQISGYDDWQKFTSNIKSRNRQGNNQISLSCWERLNFSDHISATFKKPAN